MDAYPVEENKKSKGFDFKRYLSKVARNYLWVIASVIACVGCTWVYLRYTVPLYQVGAYLQIQIMPDASKIGGSPFATGSGANAQTFADLNGEIFKLQAAPLLGEVVDSLKLNVEVTNNGRLKSKPVFQDYLPFSIEVENKIPNRKSLPYVVKLTDTAYSIEQPKKIVFAKYGVPVVIDDYKVKIGLVNPENLKRNNEYKVRFLSTESVVAKYSKRLSVGTVPKGGFGMLQVVLRDEIPERAKKFIEVLKYKYDYANYIYKNRALESEIKFLDQRVAGVDAELEQQENYVKNFKAGNQLTDVNSSANQLLGNLASIDTKKNDNAYKESLLKLVESNINEASDGKEERINVTGIQDADLASMVSKYNDLVSQKANIMLQAAPKDLRLPPLNAKLEETKAGILNRVTSLKQELNVNNRFLASQEKTASGQFSTLPAKEKDFIQVNRLLNIKQAMYVFLLQKKEDKSIEFASSGMTDSRTVDWKISNVQDPKPLVLYLIGGIAGILLPAAIIFLRMMLNKKLESSKEITAATSLPVVGEIAFAGKNSDEFLVIKDKLSPVAEHFRTLRANLFFLTHGLPSKVMLVTSGVSGEGKTFVSLNLANTIALSGKKTILVEFDLRNPSILRTEASETKPGIINFLTEDATIESIIEPVPNCENLYMINSGYPLSYNTGEIILQPKMQALFKYLKSNFEYIILDTPPVEAVSDAMVLSKWADAFLYVIRHRYSNRSSLDLIDKLYKDAKAPNAMLIVNSIQPGGDFSNLHGYGYGYGYTKMTKGKKKSGVRTNLKIA